MAERTDKRGGEGPAANLDEASELFRPVWDDEGGAAPAAEAEAPKPPDGASRPAIAKKTLLGMASPFQQPGEPRPAEPPAVVTTPATEPKLDEPKPVPPAAPAEPAAAQGPLAKKTILGLAPPKSAAEFVAATAHPAASRSTEPIKEPGERAAPQAVEPKKTLVGHAPTAVETQGPVAPPPALVRPIGTEPSVVVADEPVASPAFTPAGPAPGAPEPRMAVDTRPAARHARAADLEDTYSPVPQKRNRTVVFAVLGGATLLLALVGVKAALSKGGEEESSPPTSDTVTTKALEPTPPPAAPPPPAVATSPAATEPAVPPPPPATAEPAETADEPKKPEPRKSPAAKAPSKPVAAARPSRPAPTPKPAPAPKTAAKAGSTRPDKPAPTKAGTGAIVRETPF